MKNNFITVNALKKEIKKVFNKNENSFISLNNFYYPVSTLIFKKIIFNKNTDEKQINIKYFKSFKNKNLNKFEDFIIQYGDYICGICLPIKTSQNYSFGEYEQSNDFMLNDSENKYYFFNANDNISFYDINDIKYKTYVETFFNDALNAYYENNKNTYFIYNNKFIESIDEKYKAFRENKINFNDINQYFEDIFPKFLNIINCEEFYFDEMRYFYINLIKNDFQYDESLFGELDYLKRKDNNAFEYTEDNVIVKKLKNDLNSLESNLKTLK